MRKTLINKFTSYFQRYPIRLGGPGVNVQVDETKLNFNVKSHRGAAPTKACWALCIVDTSFSPSKGYIELLEKRNSETLLPIISRIVRPGSTIVTGEWRAYNDIIKSGIYVHKRIAHKYHFVDPQTQVHTQNVESFNNKIKYQIKMAKGVPDHFRSDFITEFIFFDTFKDFCLKKLWK